MSWLNNNGVPQVAIGDVYIPATSRNLVESKSFKLYLNSFNQTRFADWESVAATLQRDLSQCAEGDVKVLLHRVDAYPGQAIADFLANVLMSKTLSLMTTISMPIICKVLPAKPTVSRCPWLKKHWSAICLSLTA